MLQPDGEMEGGALGSPRWASRELAPRCARYHAGLRYDG